MTAVAVEDRDRVEALLWRTLLRFETLSQAQYEAHAPELLSDGKAAFVARLAAVAGPPSLLAASAVGAPIDRVISLAAGPDKAATLNIQGLLLEPLGQVIYGLTEANPAVSAEARALARTGHRTCAEIIARVPPLLAEHVGDPDALLQAFQKTTPEVIRELDALGEAVDLEFSHTLNLHFSDVMGEFAADLLERCIELGMQRRQLVVFLTSQMMGI